MWRLRSCLRADSDFHMRQPGAAPFQLLVSIASIIGYGGLGCAWCLDVAMS